MTHPLDKIPIVHRTIEGVLDRRPYWALARAFLAPCEGGETFDGF
jgi:hypothetical protein